MYYAGDRRGDIKQSSSFSVTTKHPSWQLTHKLLVFILWHLLLSCCLCLAICYLYYFPGKKCIIQSGFSNFKILSIFPNLILRQVLDLLVFYISVNRSQVGRVQKIFLGDFSGDFSNRIYTASPFPICTYSLFSKYCFFLFFFSDVVFVLYVVLYVVYMWYILCFILQEILSSCKNQSCEMKEKKTKTKNTKKNWYQQATKRKKQHCH